MKSIAPHLTAAILCIASMTSLGRMVFAQAADAKEWTLRAVAALVNEDAALLPSLASEFEKLSAEKKGKLRLAVRKDAIDIEFDGIIEDESSLSFVEYLLAAPEKEYEALMTATDDELSRLESLRPFFTIHARDGRRKWWDAQIIWKEGSKPKSVAFADLFTSAVAADRDPFLDGIEVDAQGMLGGESTTGKNMKADITKLPLSLKAVLRLTLHREAKK